MPTLRSNRLSFLFAACALASLLLFAPTQRLSADDTMLSKEEKLKQLKTQIRNVRSTLTKSTSQKNRLQLQLRKNETEIGNVTLSLKKLATQLRQQQRELKQLRQDKKQKAAELQHQQQLLAQQIRASYAMGNQGYAKLILNQKDPAAIGRTLVYFDYLNQSRTDSIKVIDKRIEALTRIESRIQHKQQQIQSAQQQQRTEKRALEEKRLARKQILSKIEKDIKNQAERLTQLEESRKQLETLLSSLSEALADIPPDAGNIKQFRQLKGKLQHPAKGRIKNRFGKRRKGGNLKWQGLTISAKTGAEVRSVHHGRVAFSDWLRGFGLLVIVDHGDGYMSLYGHNESLLKDVGEWVESGEQIATVGVSGGQSSAALYFEIRRNGKPLNPRSWLARK